MRWLKLLRWIDAGVATESTLLDSLGMNAQTPRMFVSMRIQKVAVFTLAYHARMFEDVVVCIKQRMICSIQ